MFPPHFAQSTDPSITTVSTLSSFACRGHTLTSSTDCVINYVLGLQRYLQQIYGAGTDVVIMILAWGRLLLSFGIGSRGRIVIPFSGSRGRIVGRQHQTCAGFSPVLSGLL